MNENSEGDYTSRAKVLKDQHEPYVAVVSAPAVQPRLLVGAWQHGPGPTKELFMVEMDLESAREYGKRILKACESVGEVPLLDSSMAVRH